MYMLDTNVIISVIRHPEWSIYTKVKRHLGKDICISVVTYAELEYGIKKSRNPDRNRIAINQILSGIPILDFDQKAAMHFGDIFAELERQRMRIGDRDTMIAAHARSLGYTVVTNNVREFSRVDNLTIEDWTSP